MAGRRTLLLLALLAAAANGLAAPPEPDFPATFAWKYEDMPGPAWVSAKAALDAEGNPRWDLLTDTAARNYRHALENPDASIMISACGMGDERPRGTLEGMAGHATAIFRGRIVATTPGFWGESDPVLLLKVRVESTLRTAPAFTPEPDLYVVYPGADFEFAGARMRRQDSGFDHRPAVGEKVLLFPYREPLDPNGRLLSVDPDQIFFETADGVTADESVPDHDEIRALPSVEALEALTRRKMAGDPSARAFDERACTPAPLAGFERPYEKARVLADALRLPRSWSDNGTRTLFLDFSPRQGLRLSGIEEAVRFDVDGDGAAETMAWPWGDQAILWLDRNGNGRVDDGRELFNEWTVLPNGPRAGNAVAALAAHDSKELGGDGDGAITPQDAVWKSLRLWHDWQRDAVSSSQEIFRPEDWCLASISLETRAGRGRDGNMNHTWAESSGLRRDPNGKPMEATLYEASLHRLRKPGEPCNCPIPSASRKQGE